MAKYQKLALTVTAIRADRPQYVATLEGVSEANPGDYIVTGVDNEQWVVRPEWFSDSYKHIHGDTYERIPQVLEATQIDESETVQAPTGPIRGDKGDWKITGTEGEQWFVKPDIFAKTYKKVGRKMKKSMNDIQRVVEQIGVSGLRKSLPHVALGRCDIHGMYLANPKGCPLCPSANGTDATMIEERINNDFLQNTGTNPQQKMDMADMVTSPFREDRE